MPHRLNLRAPSDCEHCGWRPQHMFCNFAPAALADFNKLGTPMNLPKGALLFHEGDPSDRVYILCDGKVKLFCTSSEGRILNLKIALPGDVLGLSGAISKTPLEVSAEVLEPVSLKVIRSADFLAFLGRQPEASMHAVRSLSDEYRAAYADARRLALSDSVTGRLASLLLDWGNSASCGKEKMSFNMVLTHDDLASFTGSTRETITRALGKLQRDGILRINGITVHVLLPQKLAELAA